MKKIYAVIFDMDGVIFNTELLWKNAFENANKKYSICLSEEYRQSTCGKSELLIRKELKKIYPELNVIEYRNYMLECVNNNIENGNFEINKNFIKIIEYLKKKGIKIGLATSSHKQRAINLFKMKDLNMDNFFDVMIFSEDVGIHSKPDPYIFLLAANKLDMDSKNCIIVEDSINGIEAAVSGQFIPIMLTDLIKPNDFCKKNAYIINDLIQIKDILED